MTRFALAILLTLTMFGCDLHSSVPPGRIRIKNDFWGGEDSTLIVKAAGSRYVLEAGQWTLLPQGTTSIVFSYTSKRKGTREYGVQCPGNPGQGITIKLIDVYMGKIAGGCEKLWVEQR
jgi:hypothetical protein